MNMEHYGTVMICPVYVCAIEYGDYSGLNDSEERQVNDWIRRQPVHAVFDWGGAVNEPRFTQDAITGLMGDCIKCKVYAPPGTAQRERNQAIGGARA